MPAACFFGSDQQADARLRAFADQTTCSDCSLDWPTASTPVANRGVAAALSYLSRSETVQRLLIKCRFHTALAADTIERFAIQLGRSVLTVRSLRLGRSHRKESHS